MPETGRFDRIYEWPRRPSRHDNVIFTFAVGPKGMKQNNRMKEWRQTIAVICTVVVASVALAAYMQFEHAAIRADMNAEHAAMRADMNAQHAAMRADMNAQFAAMHAEHAAMRADMNAQHADMNAQFAAMHAEHAAIRDQLNSVDRRTARIEGHLFGIEIPPDPADGE